MVRHYVSLKELREVIPPDASDPELLLKAIRIFEGAGYTIEDLEEEMGLPLNLHLSEDENGDFAII